MFFCQEKELKKQKNGIDIDDGIMYISLNKLLHRLMVGQRTLTPLIVVRIHVKQPSFNRRIRRFFCVKNMAKKLNKFCRRF